MLEMELYWYFVTFAFGTIVGSFLNVVIYRLHTGRSLNGRSHCLSCGKTLSWYELVPLISYVTLRARCKFCSSHIPSRYFLVELLTGASYLVLWYIFHADVVLFFLNIVLISVGIVIVIYDIRHTVIPDEMTVLITVVAFVMLAYTMFVSKLYIHTATASLLGGFEATLFLGGLWYISKGRWIGFGDVKLAFPLGVIAGSWGAISMVVMAFWIGAVVSLVLLGILRVLKTGTTYLPHAVRTITIKSEIPFAPFLIAGFLSVYLFHADIFEITSWFFPY